MELSSRPLILPYFTSLSRFVQSQYVRHVHATKLTLKSRSASIWFCIIGTVFRSFSVLIVLITPSALLCKTKENPSPEFWRQLLVRNRMQKIKIGQKKHLNHGHSKQAFWCLGMLSSQYNCNDCNAQKQQLLYGQHMNQRLIFIQRKWNW